MNNAEPWLADTLRREIEVSLARLGLLFRVFARAKSPYSIDSKLQRKGASYSAAGKKIQDLFGARVALYFPDDSKLAQDTLKKCFECDEDSSTVDEPGHATFGPTRCNLVFRLPSNIASQSEVLSANPLIDSTFEVQFRTVLSEGWHEVEHDLRYKRREDWAGHEDLDRALNGIVATLETCDWAMLKLFEDLAWRHYKNAAWEPMLHNKFRLRFQGGGLSASLVSAMDGDVRFSKKIFRLTRNAVLEKLFESELDIPMTLDNIVFLSNRFFIQNERIYKLEPQPIAELF